MTAMIQGMKGRSYNYFVNMGNSIHELIWAYLKMGLDYLLMLIANSREATRKKLTEVIEALVDKII